MENSVKKSVHTELDLLGGELPSWSPSLPESDMMFS